MSDSLLKQFCMVGCSLSAQNVHQNRLLIPQYPQMSANLSGTSGVHRVHRIYHLVIEHSHGKSTINGGFNGKFIYRWVILHGYIK